MYGGDTGFMAKLVALPVASGARQDYMEPPEVPLLERGLGSFVVGRPLVLVWSVARVGSNTLCTSE